MLCCCCGGVVEQKPWRGRQRKLASEEFCGEPCSELAVVVVAVVAVLFQHCASRASGSIDLNLPVDDFEECGVGRHLPPVAGQICVADIGGYGAGVAEVGVAAYIHQFRLSYDIGVFHGRSGNIVAYCNQMLAECLSEGHIARLYG